MFKRRARNSVRFRTGGFQKLEIKTENWIPRDNPSGPVYKHRTEWGTGAEGVRFSILNKVEAFTELETARGSVCVPGPSKKLQTFDATCRWRIFSKGPDAKISSLI